MTASDPTGEDGTRSVEIPDRTARAIEARLRGTEFGSVDDYVAFALEQLLRELDDPVVGATGEEATDEAITDRLESLGYL